jgi:hypothetical protein
MFSALYENHFNYDCSMPSRAFGYLNLGTVMYSNCRYNTTVQVETMSVTVSRVEVLCIGAVDSVNNYTVLLSAFCPKFLLSLWPPSFAPFLFLSVDCTFLTKMPLKNVGQHVACHPAMFSERLLQSATKYPYHRGGARAWLPAEPGVLSCLRPNLYSVGGPRPQGHDLGGNPPPMGLHSGLPGLSLF